MKTLITIVFSLFFISINSQTPSNDPHWNILWQDDFDVFQRNKWNYYDNRDHDRQHREVFLKKNISINSGVLAIEINKESYSCPNWAISKWHCSRQWYNKTTFNKVVPYEYTSGSINSKQPYYIRFGFIEARIKGPAGASLWPAFWTYSFINTASSNRERENDIWEPLGSQGHHEFGTNVWTSYQPPRDNQINISKGNSFDYTDWHVYSIEWSPSKIIWYVDNFAVRILSNHDVMDATSIIMNLSIENGISIQGTSFPQKMLVDYVRVYQLKNDCDSILNVCQYDFSSHDNRVKKKIIIGDGTCLNELNPDDNVYLRADESVTIQGDFNVPVRAELYIDVNPCYFNPPIIDINEPPQKNQNDANEF
jgi:beta-glucanase (GH16 family)